MIKIRIEYVGDIHSDYPYLEVFLETEKKPFMEISVSKNKDLDFKIYTTEKNVRLSKEDLSYILAQATAFLPKALERGDH